MAEPRRDIRVLVADDEAAVGRALERVLVSTGYHVDVVTSAADALERIDQCDLLLADVQMPVMTGLELLAEAKKRRPELPVILLTGYATVPLAVEAMRNGAANVISKPFKVDDIREAVELHSPVPSPRKTRPPSEMPTVDRAILGESNAMAGVRHLVARLAESNATVLITGESGCGKGVVAAEIHRLSPRKRHPLVSINCGAIPENLFESQLFGHVKGAFTGASSDRRGFVDEAAGGTLFLDEVGETPMSMQVKLLRLLQEREYIPVGATRPQRADIRVLAATNRDLEAAIAAGTFREDLYWRLNVLSVEVPPLRARPDDVLLLAHAFLEDARQSSQRVVTGFDPAALACLQNYAWPGNVRELEHSITRAVIVGQDPLVRLLDLPPRVRAAFPAPGKAAPAPDQTPATVEVPLTGIDLRDYLESVEKRLVSQALERTSGNKAQAASLLGIKRTTLIEKLKRWGESDADSG